MGGRSGLIGTVGGNSTATSHGLEGSGLGNRVKMLEMYEAGGDQANTIVTQPRFSQLNLPKLAREYRFSKPIELPPSDCYWEQVLGLQQVQLDD